MPPWILGCSVFTRPSIISGNPVTSLTSRTGNPAPRSVRAVPPVDSSSTPSSWRPRAKSTIPVLSCALTRARETFMRSPFHDDLPTHDPQPSLREQPYGLGIDPMLLDKDARGQCVLSVARLDRDARL